MSDNIIFWLHLEPCSHPYGKAMLAGFSVANPRILTIIHHDLLVGHILLLTLVQGHRCHTWFGKSNFDDVGERRKICKDW